MIDGKNIHSVLNTESDKENPFANCALGRKPFAEALTNVIDTYSGGLVLAINSSWGSGKTTFINMWRDMLSLTKPGEIPYCAEILNAWEHEYFEDPILAVLSCLKSFLPDENENHIEAANKLIGALQGIKPAKKGLAKTIISLFTMGSGGDLVDGVHEGVKAYKDAKETHYRYKETAISDYVNEINAFNDFKEAFSAYINYIAEETGHPVIIFVDELDRCNPKYSVALLEKIKHLFSTPNLIFVLAIDKEQLCSSIRGYFGSDGIKAEEYLRRFIDIEVSLPYADNETFCNSVLRKLGISSTMRSHAVQDLCEIIGSVSEIQDLSLRQIEKVCILCGMGFKTHRYDTLPFFLSIPLAVLKCFKDDIFQKIYFKQLSMSDLYETISPMFSLTSKASGNTHNLYTFLMLYQHYCAIDGQLIPDKTLIDGEGKVLVGDNSPSTIEVINEVKKELSKYDFFRSLIAMNLYFDMM